MPWIFQFGRGSGEEILMMEEINEALPPENEELSYPERLETLS